MCKLKKFSPLCYLVSYMDTVSIDLRVIIFRPSVYIILLWVRILVHIISHTKNMEPFEFD
jgi:hypothetical protein